MSEVADGARRSGAAVASRTRRTQRSAARRSARAAREYSAGDDRPLGGYLALLGAYAVTGAGLGAVAYLKRDRLPARLAVADLALVSVATFKISRLVARDSITSPLRAPFTRFKDAGEIPAELDEEVRVGGPAKAVGELLTCPFCLGQWVATALVGGLLLAPRATRIGAGIVSATAAADALQLAYSAASRAGSS